MNSRLLVEVAVDEATHLGAVSESAAIRKLQVLTRISTDKRASSD
jgi:hypothetical protein